MMKIENNLFKILKKEIEVGNGDDYLENGLEGDEVNFLKEWVGDKGKVYFCYLGMGSVDCWEVDKSLEEVSKENGVSDFNDVKIFENVVFSDDGFWVKVV